MVEKRVGVLGATSLVGRCLLPMLCENGWEVRAFSRRRIASDRPGVDWMQIQPSHFREGVAAKAGEVIPFWICTAPLWVLPDYFPLLEMEGVRHMVVLSSTSRFTKSDSPDAEERCLADRLAVCEDQLSDWAQSKGIDWVILRPTLIYGLGFDKNISEIARLVRRLGFFPLAGRAGGLRQPVHAEDIAVACVSVLEKTGAIRHAYNLSGGETLPYREMVSRVFTACGRKPRLVSIPIWLFHVASLLISRLPRYKHWNAQMAERMNVDLVFDHGEAARDLHYDPRPFSLASRDLPP